LFPDVELLFADELHRKSFFSKHPSRFLTPSSLENDCIDRLIRSPDQIPCSCLESFGFIRHRRSSCLCVE
jgi:hypothetical protein